MAKLFVIAVRDRALNAYSRPFFVPSLGLGIRSFGDEVNRVAADNQMSQHPDDFDLFHLAMFDEDTGVFESLALPSQIAIGKQMLLTRQ